MPKQSNPDTLKHQPGRLYRLSLRHARYYVGVAQVAEQQYLAGGENAAAGLVLFDRERNQLDTARGWLQKHQSEPEADTLLIADADATAHTGDLRYTKRATRIPQLECALAAALRTGNRIAQASFLGNLGNAYFTVGDLRQALDCFEQVLALARELGNRQSESRTLGNLGLVYDTLNDTHRAVELYQQRLSIARAIDDQRGEGNTLGNLGMAYAKQGDIQRAIDCYQQHLALAREIGDRRGESNALGNLGRAFFALGDARQAIDFFEQVLATARGIGDRKVENTAYASLGNAYAALGDVPQAIDFYQQHLALARELDDRNGEADALTGLGICSFIAGDAQQAIEFHQQCLALARELHNRRGEAAALGNLGNAFFALGDPHRAVEFHQQHLALARELGDRRGQGTALGNLGNTYDVLGEPRRAVEFHQQHLALTRELCDRRGEAEAHWNCGLALLSMGAPEQALPLLEAALAFQQQIGHPRASSMAATIAHVRAHGCAPAQPITVELPSSIPQATPPEQPSSNTARVIQQFLPLLGDIALAAHGDEVARQLVEAVLPLMEQSDWRITNAVRRIWAGDHDAAALTQGLDEQERALVLKVLRLVTGERELIAVAESLQIARLHRAVGRIFAEARIADAETQKKLTTQLEVLATRANGRPGTPWQTLAAHLHELVGQLRAE
ncbi:MAG TPA: tetratricopeptide repeat protein [Roseiflexaceae bacterium]|nr:tetratricopeptide repeat protein [Roseiflexaceae bacterium]